MNDHLQYYDFINCLLDNKVVREDDFLYEGYSKKTIDEIENYINYYSNQIGARIITENRTYSLKINDTFLFRDFYLMLKKENDANWLPNDRIIFIIIYLVSIDGYTKIQTLAEMLYITPRQISNYLRIIRKHLSAFSLTVKNVPHYGIIVEGDEIKRRLCLATIIKDPSATSNKNGLSITQRLQISEIRDFISEIMEKDNYSIAPYVFENLVVHIFITVNRIRGNAYVKITGIEDYSNQDYQFTKHIVEKIENQYDISITDDEFQYILMHVISKKDNHQKDMENFEISPEISSLVEECLKYIDEKLKSNFKSNFLLRKALCLHFVSMINRIRFGFTQKNPLLGEIKRKYLYEFELATDVCFIVSSKYGLVISEDEVGYIALDFRLATENRNNLKQKILVVCSTGYGSAELLKRQLLSKFSDSIETIELCSSQYNLPENIDSYDCIFTTVPLYTHTNIPVFRISYFLGDDDQYRISKFLVSQKSTYIINNYINRQLFMGETSFNDKEQALKQMIKHINKYKPLPDDFYYYVNQREEFACTSFGNRVAFPHPNKILTNETIICVAINKTPIIWGNESINVIIMASFGKNDATQFQNTLNMLTILIDNAKKIDLLIENPTFENFVALLSE